ncbi:MAG: AAA family ATPase [Gallionella sp.]|nr:AAA family ATPase [Gallionella sp.]
MRSDDGDQAEGLRRLLVSNQPRVITVVAGKAGVGRTSATINLAAALVRSGKDVLVLDENPGPNNLLYQLGLSKRHDLLDFARGKCELGDAVSRPDGYMVVSAARAMHALAQMRDSEQQRIEDALAELGGSADVLLVDAAMLGGNGGVVSASLSDDASVLVLVDATATGITESYAMIKRMALENARMRFEIVVNRVGGDKEAKAVFGNMASVARRHLAARLEYLGFVPSDAKLKRATQLGRSVVDAFPGADAAQSYLALAQKILSLPVGRGEAEGGFERMIRGLIRQVRHGQIDVAERAIPV